MKNKFFTHRFLPILSVFLLVISLSFSNVFATDEFDYSTFVKNCFPSFITLNDDGYYVINGITTNCDRYYLIEDDGDFCLIFTVNGYYDSSNNRYTYYEITDNNFFYCSLTSSGNVTFSKGPIQESGWGIWHTLRFASKDLLYSDGSVFFQKPSLGIMETLVVETNKAQIAEQLKIMIVGFLKYLIVLVISLIAFWKGWQFLLTQLKKA